MGSRIEAIRYYLPEKILTNADLEKEFSEWSASKIEEKTGVKERHVVSENETSLDLAQAASELLLQETGREGIDFILLCTQSPDYFLPTSACILQDRLHLPKNIGALDFNLGCSGFVYGLAMAKSLIQSSVAKKVLLVTAETYSRFMHPRDKGNRTIFGDAAAAALIVPDAEEHFLEFILGTDGSGFGNLIVPNGGMRHKYDPDAPFVEDANKSGRTDNHLFMDGPEIFNFTIDAVPEAFGQLLAKNQMKLEEIDFVIFHQANKFMIDYLRKLLKIPTEKFYSYIETTGNTVSSTIPIALHESMKKGLIRKGSKVLLLGFGVGYSWAGTIIRI